MAFKLVFLEQFETDLSEALEWYTKISLRNAERLMDDINSTITRLQKQPLLFQKFTPYRRKINLTTYPYKVFYEVNDSTIIIVALIHHKRHPRYWKRRK